MVVTEPDNKVEKPNEKITNTFGGIIVSFNNTQSAIHAVNGEVQSHLKTVLEYVEIVKAEQNFADDRLKFLENAQYELDQTIKLMKQLHTLQVRPKEHLIQNIKGEE